MKPLIHVVDDDAGFRKTICDILSAKGYAPEPFSAGMDALERIRGGEEPSVILVDLKLDDISGIDLLKRVREHTEFTECVVITGNATQSSAIEAVNSGAFGYHIKPFDVDSMLITLHRAVERGETLRKLRNFEVQYRTLFENSTDGISVYERSIDGTERRLIDCNDSYARMAGRTKAELLAEPDIRALQQNDLTDAERTEIHRCVQERKPFMGEFSWIRPDGKENAVEYRSVPVMMDNRLFVYGIDRDITDRRIMERERKRFEDKLRQSQKIQAIGTLAGGISHDFNNILFPIMGYAEMIMEESGPDTPITEFAGEILTASRRAKDLVMQILTFSRQAEQERRPVRLQLIVKEAMKMMQATLPSHLAFRQRINPACRSVMADPTQIHQVVVNLCTNSYHAMEEEGGTIQVILEEMDMDAEILRKHSGMAPGQYVRLSVSDNGCGMSRDVLERIFDPYFTTKGVGKGTGLGMSVVHGIVKSHDGFIDVYSEPGSGTTFHLFFPVTALDSVQGDAPQPLPAPRGNEHVLLVDDERAILNLGQRVLTRLGYKVTMTAAASEALKMILQETDRFDVLVTDHSMPGLPGIELAKRVLEKRPDFPIVLMTGFSDLVIEERARSAGIREYLVKPFAQKEIAAALRRAIDGRGKLN